MALSQLQCLDANHVNPRTNESKPEFLYCEDQRLALEALLRDGREAFSKYLESRGLRGFLSEPEQDSLRALAEPYEPDSELSPEKPEESDPPLSLHYWPDLSDTSTPEMDLGWPDSAGYRGVTRTTVYCQPPIEGQAHIKEVVRKMIAQAQKVIAVVMDMFTDVDIFRDLLDVSFKKRVSVYILLERTALPHFLSMCQRANMHTGHLKNLRIRCSGGSEFYTRSSTRVRGRLGHRFMFIDGDKAVSGSYSFTWMSSRLDRNLVTVVSGQAVETFDKLFRILYATSSSVDLHALETEPEPEKEALPQSVVAPLSAALAMKLYSPKYNLAISSSAISSPPLTANHNSAKKSTSGEISKNPEDQKEKRRKRTCKEPLQEPPPLHPYLSSLEKVCLISFLPTWPEPDPPSDVIGFINIRDSSKPLQAHLQRSEMFETSQAIRFSSPISIPKEVLPLVAKPRKLVAEQAEVKKLSQSQTPAGDLKRKLGNKTLASETQHKSARNTECEPSTNTKESGSNISNAAPRNSDKPNGSSNCEEQRLGTPNNPSILPGSHTKVCERNIVVNGFTGMQASPLTGWPIGSSTGQQAQATETSPDLQTSSSSSLIHAPLSPRSSPLTTSSPNHAPPPCSESLSPPTPKPRTVQLIIKDTVHDDGHKLQKVSIVRREQSDRGLQVQEQPAPVRDSWTANESLRDIWTVNESLRLQDGVEDVREGKFGEAQNKNVPGNYQETKIEEVVHDVKERTESQHQSKSGDVTAGAAETVDDQEENVHEDDQSDRIVTAPSGNASGGPAGSESDEVTQENRKNLVKQKATLPGGHTLQDTRQTAPTDRISSVSETSSHTSEDETGNPNTLADGCTRRAKGGALNGLGSSPELSPKSPASRSPSEVSLSSNQPDTQPKDLHIPDREPSERPLSPLGRSPSTPAPDPRLNAPGGSSRAPDLRTPTPDLSDGFGSPRALSSTTSDEYYECSDLPCCEAFENVDSSGCGIRELDSRASHANTTEEDTSESQVGSADHQAIQVEDKKNTHLEMETRGEPKAQRRDGKEAESSVNNFTHTHSNLTEAASQEGNRKISRSHTERLDERRVTRKRTDSEPASTGGAQREKLPARNEHASISSPSPLFNHRAMKPKEKKKEREWPRLEMKLRDGKKAQRRGAEEYKSVAEAFNHGNTLTEVASPREAGRAIPPKAEQPDEGAATSKTAASETSSTGDAQKERKTARDNSRDTEEDKMSHTPPQQDRGAASAAPQTIQAKSGTPPDALPVPGNRETPPRPSKPVPPPAEARKQRAKARQWPNRNSVPKSQNAHAQPIAVEPHPDSQKPTFPAEETQRQVDRKIPFSLTFSHLYSLKDKINKRPAQSKRGSGSSAAQTPKS